MTADVVALGPGDRNGLRRTVASRVRGLLAERDLRQADLAVALNMSQQSVSKRMRGKVPFDVDELEVVAGFLGVSVVQLLAPRGQNPGPAGDGYRAPTGHTSLGRHGRRRPRERALSSLAIIAA